MDKKTILIIGILGVLIAFLIFSDKGTKLYNNYFSTQNSPEISKPKGSADEELETSDFNPKYLITANSIGGISLGMTQEEVEKLYKGEKYRFKYFGSKEKPFFYILLNEGNEFLLECDIDPKDKTVRTIIVHSNKFMIENTIRPGSTIKKYLTVFSDADILLYTRGLSTIEFFQPISFRTSNTSLRFFIKSKSGNDGRIYAGKNYQELEDGYANTTQYDETRIIESICLSKRKNNF